jgi:hypothetical protein
MIPTASLLTHLAIRLNAAMASGQYDSLTVDHVYAVAHREHLFESLVIWLGADAEPLSVIGKNDRTALNEMFARMALVVSPDDFGIDRPGRRAALAFVIGMLLKGINEVVREHVTPEQQHGRSNGADIQETS